MQTKFFLFQVVFFLFRGHSHDITESHFLPPHHRPNMAAEFCFLSGYFACELCNILRDKTFRIFVFFLSSTTDICYNLGALSFFVCNIFCLIKKFFAKVEEQVQTVWRRVGTRRKGKNPLLVFAISSGRTVYTYSSTTGT